MPRDTSVDGAAITVTSTKGEVHRVAVTSPQRGIVLRKSTGVVEQVWVHDVARSGVAVFFGSEMTIRSTLVVKAT